MRFYRILSFVMAEILQFIISEEYFQFKNNNYFG